ncbi:hypothetical protein C8R46DRAFT_1107901 [Mycena filopes]|nr:hypothetical protein C8R46DRAFT_1107901 [Mycena filopes]
MSRDMNLKFTPASKGDTHDKTNQCMHCYKSPGKRPFPVCSKCKEATFCSAECQKQAWPVHKTICQMRKDVVASMADDTFPPFSIRKRLLTDFIEVHECSFQSAFSSAILLEGGIDNFPFGDRAMVVLLKYRPDCEENPSVAYSVEGCMMLNNDQLGSRWTARNGEAFDQMIERSMREQHGNNYRGLFRAFFRMEDHVVQEAYPQMHQSGQTGVFYRQLITTIDHSKWQSRVQQFVRDGLVMRAESETDMKMQLGKMKLKKGKWVWVGLTKAELVQHGYPADFPGLYY